MTNLLAIINGEEFTSVDFTNNLLTIYLLGERRYEITLDVHKESGDIEEDTNYSEGTLEIEVKSIMYCDDLEEDYKAILSGDFEELEKRIAYNFESEF